MPLPGDSGEAAKAGHFDAWMATPNPSPAPLTVDLGIEGVEEEDEETIGAVVVRRADGNDAPRRKITLNTTADFGDVTLSRSSSKVKVFTAVVRQARRQRLGR